MVSILTTDLYISSHPPFTQARRAAPRLRARQDAVRLLQPLLFGLGAAPGNVRRVSHVDADVRTHVRQRVESQRHQPQRDACATAALPRHREEVARRVSQGETYMYMYMYMFPHDQLMTSHCCVSRVCRLRPSATSSTDVEFRSFPARSEIGPDVT